MFTKKLEIDPLALRIACYTGGAGAFSVFCRWLQLQIAFNEDGLPDPSFWNIAVPLVILAAGFLFLRFVDQFRNERYTVSSDFSVALYNDGRFYNLIRWLLGGMMAVGSLALLASCETDPNALFYRIEAAVGVLAGVSFPLCLREANEESPRYRRACLCSAAPILLFAVWLVTCYKVNSINGILWAYAIEIIAGCFTLMAFFYAAGFPFCSPSPWRSLFFSMFGAFLCLTCLAEERYFGQQLMLLSSAGMLMYYNWVIIANFRRKSAEKPIIPDDGFERL